MTMNLCDVREALKCLLDNVNDEWYERTSGACEVTNPQTKGFYFYYGNVAIKVAKITQLKRKKSHDE